MNTDESKVRSYTLPPIPDSREEWEAQKGELLQTFKDCMYGEMPPPPDKVELELLSEKKFPMPLKKPNINKKTGLECIPSLFFKIGTSSTIRCADGPPSPKGKNHLYALRGEKKPDS